MRQREGEGEGGGRGRERERERKREGERKFNCCWHTCDNLLLWFQSVVRLEIEVSNSSGECQVSIHSAELHPTSCLVDAVLFSYMHMYMYMLRYV